MKALLTKFDKLMAAITFAEGNTPEYSREFLGKDAGNRTKKTGKYEQRAAVSDKKVHAAAH